MSGTPPRYEVLMTEGAAQDLERLHRHLVESASPAAAERLLDRIAAVIESLATFPERGGIPPELAGLGMREFRQTSFKPWRLIYRVIGRSVTVLVIADGRRDMQSVLARRLLDG